MAARVEGIAVEGQAEVEEDARAAALELDTGPSDLLRAAMNFDAQCAYPKSASSQPYSTKSTSWSRERAEATLRLCPRT